MDLHKRLFLAYSPFKTRTCLGAVLVHLAHVKLNQVKCTRFCPRFVGITLRQLLRAVGDVMRSHVPTMDGPTVRMAFGRIYRPS